MQWNKVMPAQWHTWMDSNVIRKEGEGGPAQPEASDSHGDKRTRPATDKELHEVALAAAADGRLDILQWIVSQQECTLEEKVGSRLSYLYGSSFA